MQPTSGRRLSVSLAVTTLGHDSEEVQDREAVEKKEKKAKKDSDLRRFGRDLTELAAKGALPPLIGRRAEMLKITQTLLQSRKNNLILVGEPGVGKTGIFR